MRWIIAGVKYDFQPHQVEAAQPMSHEGRWLPIGVVARWLRWWRCKGRRAWHGAPHDKVSAPLWTELGDCGGALISLCQGLSASVMFTPQVCWLLADCSAKAPSYQPELTGSANRNPPTAPADQTLPITALPLYIYKPLFHKVYLLSSPFHVLLFTV